MTFINHNRKGFRGCLIIQIIYLNEVEKEIDNPIEFSAFVQ